MLRIDDASVWYGQIQALRGVSLHVERHEIVTLIGANGAGKSTLMMSVFGQPPLRSGSITFEGQDLTRVPSHKVASRGITLVPEGRRVFPQMTVLENLLTGAMHRRDAGITADIEHVYATFPVLKERRSQRAGTLSGGEQQMLAIGRGLMARPKLLLLDEPSLGLAPLIIRQIFQILQKIAAEGTTIFLVEQNANMALKFAQRGYVLVNGKIALSGTSSELMANDDVQRAYLGGH